jgi:hypothetical protein
MLNLSEVRVAINVALAAVEAEYGIKIDIGNISFGADNFKCQLTAVSGEAVSDEYSDVPAAYIRDLKRNKGENAFGKKVKITGQEAIIVGLKGSSYIFKWVEGSPLAKKKPGLLRIKFTRCDILDCQVSGTAFS